MDEERIIKDIKQMIEFYENMGQSNKHLDVYLNKLREELKRLTEKNPNQ